RQQVVDAVLVDRVRVAAADLHQLVAAPGLDRREDLRRERLPELRVAELVDETHQSFTSATPACTSTSSPGATGPTSSVITSPPPSHRASPSAATSSTRIGTPASEHVVQ